MYAVWLLFSNEDDEYFRDIIQELSQRFSCPEFQAHITIYGLVDIRLKELEKIVLQSISNIKSFTVKSTEIDYSDNLWKSLFLKINKEENLCSLYKKLFQNLKEYSKYEFDPHVSLMYKKISNDQKKILVKTIQIKNNLKISSIGILKFSEKINEWKLVSKYNF